MIPANRAQQIRKLLARHCGPANAITAPSICRALGYKPSMERQVRRIISEESHLWGNDDDLFIVCSIPGAGFFVVDNLDEIYDYDNYLSRLVVTARTKHRTFRQRLKDLGISMEFLK